MLGGGTPHPLAAAARRAHRRDAPRRRQRRRPLVRGRARSSCSTSSTPRTTATPWWSRAAGRPACPCRSATSPSARPCSPPCTAGRIGTDRRLGHRDPARRPARSTSPASPTPQPGSTTATATPRTAPGGRRRVRQLRLRGQVRPPHRRRHRARLRAATPRRARRSSPPIPTAPPRTTAGCSTSCSTSRPAPPTWSCSTPATCTAGPVASVRLPRRVPIGFHGSWLPET